MNGLLTILTSKDCGCCLAYRPKVLQVADIMGLETRFIDIDSEDADLSGYDFTGLPLTIVYDECGRMVGQFQGDMDLGMIKSNIEGLYDKYR